MEERINLIRSVYLQGGEAARTRASNGALMHRVIGYALHRRDKARGEGEGKKDRQAAVAVLCWLKARAFLFGDLAMERKAKRTALLHRVKRYIRRRDQQAETAKETQ
jgi:hypothetical protein